MIKQVNVSMRNLRDALSIGLATAILALVLTYVLGAPVLLQTPQAEEGHKLFMSNYVPLIQGITGGHSSMSQVHGGPASEEQSTMQRMSHPQIQGMNSGILGKNMLGSPEGMAAAGFAAVVLMVVIPLVATAYIVSWKQEVISGARIAGTKRNHHYDTPSGEHELCDSGSHNWIHRWAGDCRDWRGKGY
jgi:hypothetical protein